MNFEQVHAYGREVTSARRARDLVRKSLSRLPDSVAEDVLLVVSELVTNALVHARTGLELHVRAHHDSVFVAVRDANVQPPRLRDAGPLDTGGRGLRIVQSLSQRWGVDVEPGGKIVWCDLPIVPPPVAPPRPGG